MTYHDCPRCGERLHLLAHLGGTVWACAGCNESWYLLDGGPFPVCWLCAGTMRGGAGPDALWRPAKAGEACGAADHLCGCGGCASEARDGWAPGASPRGLCFACDRAGCRDGGRLDDGGACCFPGAHLPTTFHGSISGPPPEL